MECYLCHIPSHFFIRKNGFDLYRCQSCGLVQTDLKKPYDQFLSDFYTVGYFTGDDGAGAYEDYGRDKHYIAKNMQTFLSRLLKIKKTGKTLDVGCAYGYFVELALEYGFDAYGIDPSDHAISSTMSHLKKRIQKNTLSTARFPARTFDAITMFDVFEHLEDPIADLRKARSLLKDDGILMIATGDTDSFAAKILKRRWTFYIPPQHLLFFNKNNCTETLRRGGFTPVSFFRIGKWLSLSYVLHLAETSGESVFARFIGRIIEILHLERFPLYLPMGDNMVVIARKDETR